MRTDENKKMEALGGFCSSFYILCCIILSLPASNIVSGVVTVGGNDPGKECVFPFVYDKNTYFECTTINNNRIPWCATTSDYPQDKKWGNCPFTGPSTTGGNSNGAPCQFPFKYKNKDYYNCTTDSEKSKRLWCATTSDYAQDPKWGYCPTSGVVTVGGNDPGKECVFPFVYDKNTYFECTTINNNRIPWCATTSDYPQDQKWGNCPFTGPSTTGGNSNGAPCQFPFKYKNKDYYNCTTDSEKSKRLWCATTSDYAQDPKWGYCPTSGIVTVGGNDPGKQCVFPFVYEKKMYFECTTINNENIPWCATTSDYTQDKKWGNCPFTAG
ncbi:epididymal sperm-binding protein 1 isoform X1 [Amia ocellicauda]|uniref:epididymal sperm-binding protein 1 isoform X1 n=2 Tax=Amia ocellicauda TaxID=2972642 RepID=UPI003464611C